MSLILSDETKRGAPIRLAERCAFSLGPIAVEPALRRLVGDGRTCVLEPRIMQVLVALAEADGEVVSRDQLVAQCWDGRIVGDNAIHRVISKIREISIGFAGGVFRIETIAKVGYRLVLDPRERHNPVVRIVNAPTFAGVDGPRPDFKPDPIAAPSASWSRRAAIAGVGSVAVGAATLLALRADRSGARFDALLAQSDSAARMDLPENNAQGVGFLEEAVALKPSNPRGWGRLALARTHASEYAPPDQVAAMAAAAQEAAGRALALDSRQPDALSALALLPPYFGDWLAAEERMKRVLAANPTHLPTIDARDFLFVAVGRARKGASNRVTYSRLEPLHARFQHRLIYSHWILGSIGEADRAADRALQLWPMHPGIWFGRLWTLAFTGRAARALEQVEDRPGRPAMPESYVELLRRSMQALASGAPSDAASATGSILAVLETAPAIAINAILIFNALGDVDRAFAVANAYLLERGPLIASVRWRDGQVSINDQRRRKTNMLFVPVSAPMRADPRFARLVEDVGLAAYWTASGVTPDYLA